MKIGFVFPSSEYLFDPFKGDPHTHFQILTVLEHHFGEQVDLSLIDLRGIKKEFQLRHIPECDVYLYSVYTLDYEEQVSIVSGLRARLPAAKHIAGGPHAGVFPEETLKIFDTLILGDGEVSIVQAITDLFNLKLQKTYKQQKPVDINLYPHPLRKYLPEPAIAKKKLMTLAHHKGLEEMLSTTVIFSRGCPYRCAFCAMPSLKQYNPGIRFRAPELITAEIEYLKQAYRIEGINLLDEIAMPPAPKKAIAHLEAIGKTNITWRGQCRVDGITPQLAKIARQSGCIAMGMGVESAEQRVLDIIDKKIKVEKAKKTIAFLKENDIEARLYLILGAPGESPDIVENMWNFIVETDPDLVYLSLFTVRPGTEVYNNPKKYGIKSIETDWNNTMHLHNRFDKERPSLTLEYEKDAPWGKSLNNEEILDNFIELQTRIKQHNLNTQYCDDEEKTIEREG